MAHPAVDPFRLLTTLGITVHAPPKPMQGGLSQARLWRVPGAPGHGDLVLRAMPGTAMAHAEREAAIQRAVGQHGIPVPPIHRVAEIDGTPVMVLGMMPGTTIAEQLGARPHEATKLGRASGEMLASIHRIPIAAMPPDPEQQWAHWYGAIDPELSQRLQSADTTRRPLHYDFQPTNLLVADGRIVAVLDWTNAGIGDPRADLGRARASLEVGMALYGDAARPAINAYWSALLDGYATAGGRIDELDPFEIAGLDALSYDLSRNAADQLMLAHLRRRREELAQRVGLIGL